MKYNVKSPIERFLSKIVILENDCWEWGASKNHKGYGQFGVDGKMLKSHRFIFEYYYGQICPDLVIDHLCQNRGCCNPIHLELVTNKENLHRSKMIRTHCRKGHLITDETIYLHNGYRHCKICRNEASCRRLLIVQ